MTASYSRPGMPPLPPPAPLANAYIKPVGTLQQSQPLSAATPPETTPTSQDNPHRALLTAWRAHHAGDWVRADALAPSVRRLIDAPERLPAVRQKLRQLAATRLGGFKLEAKVVGNAARPVRLYRMGRELRRAILGRVGGVGRLSASGVPPDRNRLRSCMATPNRSTMTGMSQNSQAADPYPWRWKKGTTGNPGGRRREEATIRELAQSYCPAAIHALAKLAGLATDANGKPLPGARADTSRIAAMRELLDRGIGRARQDLTVGTGAVELHLIAATAVSSELVATLSEQRTIDGNAEPTNGKTDLRANASAAGIAAVQRGQGS